MIYTRRDVGKIALAAVPVARLAGAAKPNSNFGGVQLGIIAPYSFRGMSSAAEDVLKGLVELGLSGVELQNSTVEAYAGAPAGGGRGGPGGSGQARGPGGPPGGPEAAARRGPEQGRGEGAARGGGRAPLTPEQQEAQRKAAEAMKKWRLSVSMDKYKALRKMYNDAGVNIYEFKLGLNESMSDEEYDYTFDVAEALGAIGVTMELPSSETLTKRIGEFAAKRRMGVGYHNHTQVNFNSWDAALAQSKYNRINFDVGHYAAATGQSPIPFIQKHAGSIQSLHIKDRKFPANGGQNMPWGQGDTGLKEVFQFMRKQKYRFPASIELEYPVPEGSTVMAELKKCVDFTRNALA